eukprot:NODE_6725_length_1644_cov_8.990112.p1 GENE.NODE_6725_length_1644_cov_8.990112~~NODE_6725_length_1644_cov_8.990112.p1  ORF type:complete len:460 (+),score=113.30 NODE_6725_length_1644_cov_8.990112:68-1381(+)
MSTIIGCCRQLPYEEQDHEVVLQQELGSARGNQLPETYVPPERNGDEGVYFSESSAFARHCVASMPALNTWDEWYQAPFWLRQGDAMTLWRRKFFEEDKVDYDRYVVDTSDGGVFAVDIACNSASSTAPPVDGSAPIVMLLPGGNGDSQDLSLVNMAAALMRHGYAVVALNMRGCGNCPLKTARPFSLYRGATDDVRTAIRFLRRVLISCPEKGSAVSISVIGWCAGASVAINALAEQTMKNGSGKCLGGGWARIDAGIGLGTPYDVQKLYANLEASAFRRGIYNARMAKALVALIAPAEEFFRRGPVPQWPDGKRNVVVDFDMLKASETIRDVDQQLTCKIFGYSTVDEYCYDSSCFRRLKHINVPLLLVNSADDPIVTSWIPCEEVRKNPNIILVYTKHGGHIVWHDLSNPRRARWAEAVACDFLDTVVQTLVAL